MKIYDLLWSLGELSGCHQLPDRSLFIKGRQFPVCARCTGVWLGYPAGTAMYFFADTDIRLSLLLCGIMFADWFLQYTGVLLSTNHRRLASGFLCGMGYMDILLKAAAAIFF